MLEGIVAERPGSIVLPAHRVRHGTIYPDGWTTPYLSIEFPGLIGRAGVELEFWNPDAPELDGNEVVVRVRHRLAWREADLRAGEVRHIMFETEAASPPEPLQLSLRSAERFVPKPPDTRVLALVVRMLVVTPL